MLILDAVNSISTAMTELDVKPEIVEETTTALKDVLTLLGDDKFAHNAVIGQSSFGTVTSGTALSFHHGLAHDVMASTLAGIAEDISAFATNVSRAATLLDDVDANTAQDLKQREVVIDQFTYLSQHSHGDSNYNQGRQDNGASEVDS